jgi:hypothetical protein
MKTQAFCSMLTEPGSPCATGRSRKRGVLTRRTTGVWRAACALCNGSIAKASHGASAGPHPHGGCIKVFDSTELHDQYAPIAEIHDNIYHGKVGHSTRIVRYSAPAMLRLRSSRWSY